MFYLKYEIFVWRPNVFFSIRQREGLFSKSTYKNVCIINTEETLLEDKFFRRNILLSWNVAFYWRHFSCFFFAMTLRIYALNRLTAGAAYIRIFIFL